MPVGTEVVLIVFYYDKPTIPYQPTACIDHLATLRRFHQLAVAPPDLDALARRIAPLEALDDLPGCRPPPAQL